MFGILLSDAWVGVVHTLGTVTVVFEGEGTVGPTVRVHHFLQIFQILVVAFNGVSEELGESLHQAEETEKAERELVVESEGQVVYQASLGFQH